MRYTAVFTLILVAASCIMTHASENPIKRDIMPDTWVATDDLGRKVADFTNAPPPQENKTVGAFYFLWLGPHHTFGPYDITKILAEDPDAINEPDNPLWGPPGAFHHWGEPLFGYYLSWDPWVLRKHAEMLSDAQVDVVIFDVSNQFIYPQSYIPLCEVWSQIRREGGTTPDVAFLCPFWTPKATASRLYAEYYANDQYKDLWFQWDGKPLLMADFDKVEDHIKEFFTLRACQPSYFDGPRKPNDWGWLEVYPQHVFKDADGNDEQMVVGVAQNAQMPERKLAAFTWKNPTGRSWHNGAKDERPNAVDYGLNFQEQWDRALEVSPEFIFITSWNEWVAQRLDKFLREPHSVVFVDCFTEEYSRDVEPMVGGYKDNYYMQMISNIRKYKGVRKPPSPGPETSIDINGDFKDWDDVGCAFYDTLFDTTHRNHPGYDDAGVYVNETGRNDFTMAKVARDDKNVYFMVRCAEKITPHTDENWMQLLINIDRDHKTGWEGFDYIINRSPVSNTKTTLEKLSCDFTTSDTSEVDYKYCGKELHIAVPRSALGISDGQRISFEFKWFDNNIGTGDIMKVYTDGDTAPDTRFSYLFSEEL